MNLFPDHFALRYAIAVNMPAICVLFSLIICWLALCNWPRRVLAFLAAMSLCLLGVIAALAGFNRLDAWCRRKLETIRPNLP